jgi:hypothetical protein
MESACSSETPEQTYYPPRCNSQEEHNLIKTSRENLETIVTSSAGTGASSHLQYYLSSHAFS